MRDTRRYGNAALAHSFQPCLQQMKAYAHTTRVCHQHSACSHLGWINCPSAHPRGYSPEAGILVSVHQIILSSEKAQGRLPLHSCILPLIFLLNQGLHAELERVLPKVDRDTLPQTAIAESICCLYGLSCRMGMLHHALGEASPRGCPSTSALLTWATLEEQSHLCKPMVGNRGTLTIFLKATPKNLPFFLHSPDVRPKHQGSLHHYVQDLGLL